MDRRLVIAAAIAAAGIRAAAAQPAPPGLPPPLGMGGPPPAIADGPPGGAGRPSPQAICLDALARDAGRRAYIAARLTLTAEQKRLWSNFESASESAGAQRHQACLKLPAIAEGEPPPLRQRAAELQELLSARLAELQQTQDALAALDNSLSPEQHSIAEGLLSPPLPPLPLR